MYAKRRKSSDRVNEKSKNDKKQKKSVPEYEGKVQMTREGALYVIVEGLEGDIHVKAGKTQGALNGDTVRVAVTKATSGPRPMREGTVKEIVQRSGKPFVGVLHIVGPQAWVLMQSRNMPYDISVDIVNEEGLPLVRRRSTLQTSARRNFAGALTRHEDGSYTVNGVHDADGDLKAVSGMKVAVVVDSWPREEPTPHGYLTDVLGTPGDNNTEMHAILAEYGLPYRFEKEVENAADSIPDAITAADIKSRRDLRDTLTFTIDPADAKDFDDALSYRKLPNGNFEVGVHIADVSWYVRPGSVVDKEARERGTSVYLVDRTVPMLPEKLSNKLCSLRPNEEKLTFSAIFEITPQGQVINQWMGRTVIRSDWRYAYEEAQEVLEGRPAANLPKEQVEALLELNRLALIFRRKRFAAGAISFERPEMKVEVDENGKPIRIYEKITKEANWLIEEFMLLANRTVAEFVATGGKMNGKAEKNAKTFVYRIHDEPNEMKIDSLRSFAGHFGYKMEKAESGRGVAKSLNSLLDAAKGTPEADAFQMIALRAMAKACYSTDNIGHYGLAFPFYTHFTSPIRRYPDLMVHRLLAAYLKGGESAKKDYYELECQHASEREVIAANAERDSIKYKLVEYMMDKVGGEFDGHISGLTDWGMYVEIEPSKVEGMVALREIKSDFYEFDEDNYLIRGKRTGHVFHLGDAVRIRVKNANLEQRIIDYELLEEHLPKTEKPRTAKPAQSTRKPARSTRKK